MADKKNTERHEALEAQARGTTGNKFQSSHDTKISSNAKATPTDPTTKSDCPDGNGQAVQQPRNKLTPYTPDKMLMIEVYQLEPDLLSNQNKTASATSSIPWRLCGKKVLNISKNKPLTLTEQVIVQDCIDTVKTFPDVLVMPHPNDGCAIIRDNNAALLLQQK